jgi:hypothetical protein
MVLVDALTTKEVKNEYLSYGLNITQNAQINSQIFAIELYLSFRVFK